MTVVKWTVKGFNKKEKFLPELTFYNSFFMWFWRAYLIFFPKTDQKETIKVHNPGGLLFEYEIWIFHNSKDRHESGKVTFR